MAAKLSNLKKSIQKAKLSGDVIQTESFLVICIHRYLTDPKHIQQVGTDSDAHRHQTLDVIQLTIGDETHKMKVILSDRLNIMVQTCQLQAGHRIKITKCRLQYDETDLSGTSVVIIDELEITGYVQSLDPADFQNLQWCQDCSKIEQTDIPMTSSRGYYVSLWASMEMYGDIWKTSGTTEQLSNTEASNIYSIKEIVTPKAPIPSNPALLVKVLSKSRMIQYAKPGRNDKWPFQAHLCIGDSSGCCYAVLWNATCPNYYHRIKSGSILYLKKYTARKSYQFMSRFKPAMKDLQVFDTDININSTHPAAEVKIVDLDSLPDNIELPPLQWKFVTRKQAGGLPHDFHCDIAGVVTFVGRYEREPMNNKLGTDTGGFWLKRWIHIRDQSSQKPFVLELYQLAEGMVDLDLHPGSLVVVSHVRVIQKLLQLTTSRGQREIYFTTTAETEVSLLDDVHLDFARDKKFIHNLKDWMTSADCLSTLRSSYTGGYINFPSLPQDLDSLKTYFKETQIVVSSDWGRTLSHLCYRETRKILIQATMVYAKLNVEHCNLVSKRGKSPKKARPSNVEVVLNSDIMDNDDIIKLGRSDLDLETFPCVYSADDWPEIKQRLAFPVTDICTPQIDSSNNDLTYSLVPYFTIVWAGLNSQVCLQSHLPCNSMLGTSSSFIDILAGSRVNASQNALDHQKLYRDLSQSMTSVGQCENKQFLVVLDCYERNHGRTEIIVNRAVPIN